MSPASFLKLVEIQTKVASVIPFALGTVYVIYRFQSFNLKNFILMFISLLTFDMATTAVNNYIDYKKAYKTHGFNYESHNAIVRDRLTERSVISVIFILLSIATVFGIILFLNTDIIILLLGALSFMIGISYSFGPVPISRTPLGEAFSGLFMGLVITFISAYIHVFEQGIILAAFREGTLKLTINVTELLYILLISVPAIVGIANIMLANNICDIEDDIENKRYTLPIYIGKANALKVFKSLYYIAYFDMLVLFLLRVMPPIYLLSLLTIIPVTKNIMLFYKKQTKKDTFVLAVKNFVLMNMAQVLFIGTAAMAKYIGF